MENKLRGNYEVSVLKQYQLKIEALRIQRNSIIAQNHAMQAELQSIIKKIKQKYLQFEISKVECDWLEEKLEKLKPEYELLKSKRDFLIGELKHLEPNIEDAKEQSAILKTKNDLLQGKVSLFDSQIRILKDKIKRARLEDKDVIVE